MTERGVRISRGGEGPVLTVADDHYRLLATGDDTAGTYMIMEATVPPGGGPPLHRHSREEEGFHVLDGEIEFEADGRVVRAGPGTFLNLPRGSRHRFRNAGDVPARMLILCTPAGIEAFFREADGRPPEALAEIAARYGVTISPPD